jgi:hypothetical protein
VTHKGELTAVPPTFGANRHSDSFNNDSSVYIRTKAYVCSSSFVIRTLDTEEESSTSNSTILKKQKVVGMPDLFDRDPYLAVL